MSSSERLNFGVLVSPDLLADFHTWITPRFRSS
jgi:hypothetical protein